MSDRIKVAIGLLALVLLMGVVGRMDYEDAQLEEALYCDNVRNGVWPDYEGTYKNICKSSAKTLDELQRSK